MKYTITRVLSTLLIANYALISNQCEAAPAGFIPFNSGTYTQDFNALPSTGTDGITQSNISLLTGWYAGTINKNFSTVGQTDGLTAGVFSPTNPQTVTFSTGAQAATTSGLPGRTFNWGVAGANPVTDRALGVLVNGVDSAIEARFTNETGGMINSLTITFDGEQWRQSGSGVPNTTSPNDRLMFTISRNGTSYTSYAVLDFVAPKNPGSSASALDGNLAANRAANITATITGYDIGIGSNFYLRWYDQNQSGTEQGKAIDNFSLSVTSIVPPNQTTSWIATSPTASWYDYTSWSTGTPTTSGFTTVNDGHTAYFTTGSASIQDLKIGTTNTGYMIQSGGSLNVSQVNFSLGHNAGSFGKYTISDGQLTVLRRFRVGMNGEGEFLQTGGTVTLQLDSMSIGEGLSSKGIYRLSGGNLDVASRLDIGMNGEGQFVQTGGTATIQSLVFGNTSQSQGSGQLDGGLLKVQGLTVGLAGRGTFEQNGGTLEAADLSVRQAANGSNFTLSGSTSKIISNQIYVGTAGTGSFVQNAGLVQITNGLRVASGTYEMHGGQIAAAELYVNEASDNAKFVQSAGDINLQGKLFVGYGSSAAKYELSGGTLTVGGDTCISCSNLSFGMGIMEQTGGLHQISGSLILGQKATNNAQYLIQNGTLDIFRDLIVGADVIPLKRFSVVGGLADIEVGRNFVMGPSNTLQNQPVMESFIDQTGLSTIEITGTATLRGRLSVDLLGGFFPSIGQQYEVLHAAGGISGSWILDGPDANFFQMVVTPQSVFLITQVPEPSTWMLSGFMFTSAIVFYARRLKTGAQEKGPRTS